MAGTEVSPAPLEAILCTEELDRRGSREPDFEKENRALVTLIQTLNNSPHTILQVLTDTILDVLECGSAGISLLTEESGVQRFYWPAIAGAWQSHIGGGTPRNFGPCGDVLDRKAPLLFRNVELRYTYLQPVTPRVEEALLVPFFVGEEAVGTIWAIAHDDRKFNAEDRRLLLSLAQFASAAYQSVSERRASRHLAAIVASSDDAIISKNLDGVISSWNNSAERLFGYSAEEAIGKHITLIVPSDRLDEEAMIIAQIRRGERVEHFETIRRSKDGKLLDISLTISPVRDETGRVIGASKIARDITERREAEKARKESELSARLLQVQDAERRRIARELHDGVGQLLVAIGMNVAQVLNEKEKLDPLTAKCVEENRGLIDQASTDIRTVSYLLHPPMLDEVGLRSALKLYLEGFAARSKIEVTMELDSDVGRLSQDQELSLFRIAQECLANVHRHSGSSTALVRLSKTSGEIELLIKDAGQGIDPRIQSKINAGVCMGVGLRGMQERVRLIGGTLTISSDETGTSVRVVLPAPEHLTNSPE
jgi:PAS domain S-box-containing protein